MLESPSFWLYFPDVSFIARDLGEQGVYVVVSGHPEVLGRLHQRCWETTALMQFPSSWASLNSCPGTNEKK
jgi:hypothetical protein